MQPLGAADPVVPSLPQASLVRAGQAWLDQAGAPVSWSAVAAVA
jgi:hypothetical protein